MTQCAHLAVWINLNNDHMVPLQALCLLHVQWREDILVGCPVAIAISQLQLALTNIVGATTLFQEMHLPLKQWSINQL